MGTLINQRISTVLLYLTSNVSLKFVVNLVGKNRDGIDIPNLFHTTYENTKGRYHTYDVFSYLSLELKDYENGWDRSKSIMITPRSIFQFITHVNVLIGNIYQKDSFYVDPKTKETKLNVAKLDDYTVNAFNLSMNQRMIMRPSLVYDKTEDTMYEGAEFMLNMTDNVFYIPIDTLEAMKYTLDKFDFFMYTHMMLQYYFTVIYNPDEEPIVNKPPVLKPSIFKVGRVEVSHQEPEELSKVVSTVAKEPSKEDVFDI